MDPPAKEGVDEQSKGKFKRKSKGSLRRRLSDYSPLKNEDNSQQESKRYSGPPHLEGKSTSRQKKLKKDAEVCRRKATSYETKFREKNVQLDRSKADFYHGKECLAQAEIERLKYKKLTKLRGKPVNEDQISLQTKVAFEQRKGFLEAADAYFDSAGKLPVVEAKSSGQLSFLGDVNFVRLLVLRDLSKIDPTQYGGDDLKRLMKLLNQNALEYGSVCAADVKSVIGSSKELAFIPEESEKPQKVIEKPTKKEKLIIEK